MNDISIGKSTKKRVFGRYHHCTRITTNTLALLNCMPTPGVSVKSKIFKVLWKMKKK